jgi:hypothetical protein
VQPDEEDYRDWLGHPVTEWVVACMNKQAAAQKAKWAEMAWEGDLDPLLLNEARVRADCYLALPESSFADWKAINDTET